MDHMPQISLNAPTPSDILELDEFFALADVLSQGTPQTGLKKSSPSDVSPTWNITMPMGLEPVPPLEPLQETVRGLAMREVDEPEVFKRFFGG